MHKTIIKLLIFTLFLFLTIDLFSTPNDKIYIAIAGPLDAATGISMKNGINLYFKKVNQNGGIYGKKIEVILFNDKDNAIEAKKVAVDIINNNQIMAVIGHWASSCSIAAGKIYKNNITAISPGSTNIRVTKDNEWYFRTIFNDEQQGNILAFYAFDILKKESVIIIGDRLDYGKGLTESFSNAFRNFNGRIIDVLEIDSNKTKKYYKENFKVLLPVIKKIKNNENAALFLALPSKNGFQILEKLREKQISNTIITPDSFATNNLLDSNEKKILDGVYVSSPLIFDAVPEEVINFKEEYNNYIKDDNTLQKKDPDWLAVYSYDTAKIIVEVLKNIYRKKYFEYLKDNFKKPGKNESKAIKKFIKRKKIKISRRDIRDELASFNSFKNSIEGITGLNYFDKNGDPSKPIPIGRYRNNRIISTMTQLILSNELDRNHSLDEEITSYILKDNIKYFFKKKNVVVTGVKVNKIYDFDKINSSCKIDFNLWFRFNSDIQSNSIDNIVFTNSTIPFYLSNYVNRNNKELNDDLNKNKIIVELAESLINNDFENSRLLNYKLYHIIAPFQINTYHGNEEFVYNQQKVSIQFKHQNIDINNLIYVTDIEGIRNESNKKIKDDFKKNNILDKNSGLTVTGVKVFSESDYADTLGRPEYIGSESPFIKFSVFNFLIKLKKNNISLRGILSVNTAKYFLLFSIIIFFILLIIFIKDKSFKKRRILLIFIAIVTLTLLIALEIILLNYMFKKSNYFYLSIVDKIFDLFWWIIPAIFFHLFLNFYIFKNLELKKGKKISGLLKSFIATVIYMLTLFAIIALVFNKRITSLLATSGLVAMIIGLAIQNNLSNIFSGIALNIENSIRVGDWIRIDEKYEGQVLDITWRTTRIQTAEGIVVNIPNHIVSISKIYNMNNVQKKYEVNLTVHVDPKYSPSRVIKVLKDAVFSVYEIEIPPDPIVQFIGISDKTADYSVCYFIKDYFQREKYKELTWKRIWIHLVNAEISPALGGNIAAIEAGEKKLLPDEILRQIDIFNILSDDEIKYLSQRMTKVFFKTGSKVINEGEKGMSLFIVAEGVLSVRIKSEKNKKVEIARHSIGSFFGEMSLLTGKTRCADIVALTDSYLYEITKYNFEPIIKNNYELVSKLSDILIKYDDNIRSMKNIYKDTDKEEKRDSIFKAIQKFFNIKSK